MRVKNKSKTRVWEDSSLCPETSTKNAVQELHLWGLLVFFSGSLFKVKVFSHLTHILLNSLPVVSHLLSISPLSPNLHTCSLLGVLQPTQLHYPLSHTRQSFPPRSLSPYCVASPLSHSLSSFPPRSLSPFWVSSPLSHCLPSFSPGECYHAILGLKKIFDYKFFIC